MLRDLNIKNVAIIDSLHVEFSGGLNLLTGETGAGKSIIIDSLGLALGSRGSADLVRSGAKQAFVEAVFTSINDPEIIEIVRNCGIDFEAGGELILRRRLNAGGTSRAFINDSQVNIGLLKQVGQRLVTVHGQAEGDEILSSEGQSLLLDAYAGSAQQRTKVQELHKELTEAVAELDRTITDERSRARELDLLSHQINEIDSARLDPEEEKQQKADRKILGNSARLKMLSEEAFYSLYESEDAVSQSLAKISTLLQELAEYSPDLSEAATDLQNARYTVDEISTQIRDFTSRLEDDPKRLEQIEARLDVIRSLQRKYGDTTEEVLAYLEEAKSNHKKLLSADESAEVLKAQVEKLSKLYDKAATKLSALRKAAVDDFAKEVHSHLAELAMEKARFDVELLPHPRGRTKSGIDKVTFLISTNPGEPLKPLARIASGGELSRLMLAVKSCVAGDQMSATAIFDEVDSGIGGKVAEFAGRKLKGLTSTQQVICITHLPQIAAYGDSHGTVFKSSEGGRTRVNVESLDSSQRVEEIARMLGGEEITKITLQHAREMLDKAGIFARRDLKK